MIPDIEKVIKGLEDIQKHLDTGYSFAISWKSELIRDALALLKEQKEEIEQLNRFVNGFSRDAMPVVRCKDCKYFLAERGECLRHHFVIYFSNGNWFCADGKLAE